jgi:alanine racemase
MMGHRVSALIDLSALRDNLDEVRRRVGPARVMAVVKSDAYGHGAGSIAACVDSRVDAFGVATVEEAVMLRTAGIESSIAVLSAFHHPSELAPIAAHRLQPVIHCVEQLRLLAGARERPGAVWVKIDTGMHRVGFAPEELPGVLAELEHLTGIHRVRLMSHLANADDPDDDTSERQIALFRECCRGYGHERSLANSAGVVGWPQSHLDWVRPGLMLYGASPMLGESGAALGLRPVMTLRSILIAVRALRRGDHVGYGGTWTCPQDMLVGVVGCGYGDGYPRHAGTDTPVLLNGRLATVVGRVSMDMLSIDLRGHPRAAVGDPVILWGNALPVERIAAHANTISYQLLCGVTARVPRVIHDDGE